MHPTSEDIIAVICFVVLLIVICKLYHKLMMKITNHKNTKDNK